MVSAIIDLGIMRRSMFETRFSHWREIEFTNKEEARIYAKGIVCGLQYKWVYAACELRFNDGTTEEFNEEVEL